MIREIKKEVRKYPNINLGGCGVAALVMYRQLKAHNKLNKQTKFVYLYERCDEDAFIRNTKILAGEKHKKACAATHIVLYHNGRYHDCIKSYTMRELKERGMCKAHYISGEKFVKRSINAKSDWNPTFSREGIVKDFNLTGIKI